jgi:hypothetical protein
MALAELTQRGAVLGVKFKLDPARVLFSLQPSAQRQAAGLLRARSDPQGWFGAVAYTLLGELQQRVPHLLKG